MQIHVGLGKFVTPITLNVQPHDTIQKVKTEIADKMSNVKEKEQELIFPGNYKQINDDYDAYGLSTLSWSVWAELCYKCAGEQLENNYTLSDYNIQNGAILYSLLFPSHMTIFIITLEGRTYTIDTNPDETLFQLKDKIFYETGYPPRLQILVYGRKHHLWNRDNWTLRTLNIQNEMSLHLVLVLGQQMDETEIVYNDKDHTISITRYAGKDIGMEREIKLKSFHVSCRSDEVNGQDMAGIVLYSYDRKHDWRLNEIHCKSGYVILKSVENIEHIENNQGVVHGKCYESVFEEPIDKEKVVGGGFAFRKGIWKFNSYTFNDRDGFDMKYDGKKNSNNADAGQLDEDQKKSDNEQLAEKKLEEQCERWAIWRKRRNVMHPMEQQCILKAINNWKQGTQNTFVKDVTDDYDGYCTNHKSFYEKKNYHKSSMFNQKGI
eukprot:133671_1